MGFFQKLRETFIYDDEVTEPKKDDEIKKERIPVEIKSPVSKDTFEDREDLKGKEVEEPKKEVVEKKKDDFPIFFDDSDFKSLGRTEEKEEIEKPVTPTIKPYSNSEYNKNSEYKKDAYSNTNYSVKKQDKHVFHPTPIISPIYGVLDKNYHKEDIIHKGETLVYKDSDGLTIDDIRNKAFGTLEDEIESSLGTTTKTTISITKEKIEPIEEIEDTSKDEIFDELESDLNNTKSTLDEINETKPRTRYSEDKSYDDIMFDDLVPKERTEEVEDSRDLDDTEFDYKSILSMTDDMYKKGEDE